MAKKPLSKAQSQRVYLFWLYIFLFIAVLATTNFLVSFHFTVSVQVGPPDHDSPFGCSKRGFLQCTTRKGKCTKRKEKCEYPEKDYQCFYLMFKKQLTSDKVKQIKAKYTEQSILQQKLKVFQQYCASNKVRLYKHLLVDLSPTMWIFQLVVSSILFCIFYKEFADISHTMAQN